MKPISSKGTAMAGGGGDVDNLLLGSDSAAEGATKTTWPSLRASVLPLSGRPEADSHVPVLFWGLDGWESGDVRLCLRPTSSDGDVGRDDTGGVCARRVGARAVVG